VCLQNSVTLPFMFRLLLGVLLRLFTTHLGVMMKNSPEPEGDIVTKKSPRERNTQSDFFEGPHSRLLEPLS